MKGKTVLFFPLQSNHITSQEYLSRHNKKKMPTFIKKFPDFLFNCPNMSYS